MIGPMVVGAVVFEKTDLDYLESLGVKDSKLLSPGKREELYPQIKKKATFYKVNLVSPADIDEVSLNKIDLQEIISFITKFNPDKVIFDVPTNPAGVANFVKAVRLGLVGQRPAEDKSRALGPVLKPGFGESAGPVLIGENKADERYPIVSAASILAKVERDRVIKTLHKEYGDFGSGYMSDEKTQNFLSNWFKEHRKFPPIVRHKWSSAQKFLQNQKELL